MYFIYSLSHNNQIRYVGITNNLDRRFKEHLKDTSNLKKYDWITNNDVKMNILTTAEDLEEARILEEVYIKKYKKNLFNTQHNKMTAEQAIINAKRIIKGLK